MKNFLKIAIFLIVSSATAQIQLKGIVKDLDGTPLEMANLIAINTKTQKLESYSFSDAFGNYKLNLDTNSTYTIKASYVGMKTKEIAVVTEEVTLTKNITLETDNTLDEVEIISKMPVTIKGDTIVYNADSFKTGTEKKLGDILEKLPGMEVNDEGEIKVEGKTVKKVMVDGKDFFDGDSKLATKNIPANAIDKVQVLKNHSEVSQMSRVTDNEDNVVINIKLKEGKKNFWFGEVTAGVGVGTKLDRYLVHPKLFYYSPKGSVNIITDFNNIGEIPFTMRDYFKFTGGFRGLNRGTSFNISSSDIGFLTLKNNKAKEIKSRFGAINFSYEATKKWAISGFAIYSGNNTDIEQNTQRNYIKTESNNANSITKETTQSVTEQKSNLGIVKLSSSYKPNTNNQLDYDVIAKTSAQTKLQNLTSNRIAINGTETIVPINEVTEQNPFSVNQNLNYYYTLDEKNIFALEAKYLWKDEDPFYNAKLSQLSFANQLGLTAQSLFDVSQNKRVKTNKLDAELDYYYVINNKSNLNLTLGATVSNQKFNSDVFQVLENGTQQNITNSNTKNNVNYAFDDYFLGVHYKFITGIFTFTSGFTLHQYATKNTQLGSSIANSFTKILPDATIKVAFKKSETLRLVYSKQVNFTDINSVAEGYVFSNYSRLYAGNRNLESSLSHNLSLNYFSFNLFNYTNVFASVNYNKRIDAVKRLTVFNGVDQNSTSINSAFPDESISVNFNWQKRYRKFKLIFGGSLSYLKSNNLFFSTQSNTNENRESNTLGQVYRTRISTNFRDAPNFDIGYTVGINRYNQGGRVNRYTRHSPFINLDTFLTEDLIFNTKYTYNNYRNEAQTINNYSFWDADLTYQKGESKWEYILKISNILNTKALNDDSSGVIFNSTSSYIIQPRYTTFTIKYNL